MDRLFSKADPNAVFNSLDIFSQLKQIAQKSSDPDATEMANRAAGQTATEETGPVGRPKSAGADPVNREQLRSRSIQFKAGDEILLALPSGKTVWVTLLDDVAIAIARKQE